MSFLTILGDESMGEGSQMEKMGKEKGGRKCNETE
jgi:hypothetical protein